MRHRGVRGNFKYSVKKCVRYAEQLDDQEHCDDAESLKLKSDVLSIKTFAAKAVSAVLKTNNYFVSVIGALISGETNTEDPTLVALVERDTRIAGLKSRTACPVNFRIDRRRV